MTVTVVKIWTIEADQLPVHYPTSTSTSTSRKHVLGLNVHIVTMLHIRIKNL